MMPPKVLQWNRDGAGARHRFGRTWAKSREVQQLLLNAERRFTDVESDDEWLESATASPAKRKRPSASPPATSCTQRSESVTPCAGIRVWDVPHDGGVVGVLHTVTLPEHRPIKSSLLVNSDNNTFTLSWRPPAAETPLLLGAHVAVVAALVCPLPGCAFACVLQEGGCGAVELCDSDSARVRQRCADMVKLHPASFDVSPGEDVTVTYELSGYQWLSRGATRAVDPCVVVLGEAPHHAFVILTCQLSADDAVRQQAELALEGVTSNGRKVGRGPRPVSKYSAAIIASLAQHDEDEGDEGDDSDGERKSAAQEQPGVSVGGRLALQSGGDIRVRTGASDAVLRQVTVPEREGWFPTTALDQPRGARQLAFSRESTVTMRT